MSEHPTPNAPDDDESYFSGLIEETEKPTPWYRTGPAIVGTIAAIIAIVAVLMTIVLSTDKRVVNDNTPLTSTPPTPSTTTAEPSRESSTTTATTTTTTESTQEPVTPAPTSEPTYYDTPTSTTYQWQAPAIPSPPAIPPIPPIPPIPQIPAIPQIPGL